MFVVKSRFGDDAGRHYIMEVVQAASGVASEIGSGRLMTTRGEASESTNGLLWKAPLAADDYERCPFAINLEKVVRTGAKCRYFLEYPSGGSLRALLRRRSAPLGLGRPSSPRTFADRPATNQLRVSEEEAAFYLAEIACALSHLHSSGVAYGDLSVDNALLDADGHVKLVRTIHAQTNWVVRARERLAGNDCLGQVVSCEEERRLLATDWRSFVLVLAELLTGRRQENLSEWVADDRCVCAFTCTCVRACVHALMRMYAACLAAMGVSCLIWLLVCRAKISQK